MATRLLKLASGPSIVLGTELGRGGEGAVFEIMGGRSGDVAKIYHKAPGRELAAKLDAMCLSGGPGITRLAAWPTDVVTERGYTVGFVMPRASGYRPAFELYGPKLRLQSFPKADWRFLIRACANTARAFAAIHDAGQVIGDVNHGNLVIAQDATVRLIDCDSFQISAAGRTWFCEVGVPTHQPPEMQGLASYSGVTRTANHDAFGLAVLVFQTLCMARHPYSGKWLGSGDPPAMEEAIRAFRYAYAADQRTTGMAPPQGSLPAEALGPEVGRMFEKAFLASGARPGSRPSALDWVAAMDGLAASLRQCPAYPGHHHIGSLRSCPWCRLESGGVRFFPAVLVSGATGADGFMVLWHQVETTALPGPRDPLPEPSRSKATRAARLAGSRRGQALATLSVAAAVFWFAVRLIVPALLTPGAYLLGGGAILAALACLNSMMGRPFRKERAVQRARWSALTSLWSDGSKIVKAESARTDLGGIKGAYDAAVSDRAAKLRTLEANRRASQMSAHLDRFRIAGAGVKGVGDGKAAILLSSGIETAADIDQWKILQISGFGPKTVANLMGWRRSLEAAFRFDPSKPVLRSELDLVENAFTVTCRDLERKLAAKLAELRTAVADEKQARADLAAQHARLAPAYAQALADSRAALIYA